MYTKSFRDPDVWKKIRNILEDEKSNKRKIFRAWSAGCSTGEEAYSLASVLHENFESGKVYWKVYGTDIVPIGIQNNTKKFNDKIRFKHHNLAKEPPFRLMNLVLCRNVLMFFTHEYQEIICDKLYDSLNTGGYLVLGNVESLRGESADKFRVIDKRLRIFQKI